MDVPPIRVRLIGRVAVVSGEQGASVLSGTQQIILTRLAVRAPVPVPWEDLARAVWGDAPPASARAAIQNQISRIRALSDAQLIDTDANGYALVAATDISIIREATILVHDEIMALRDRAPSAESEQERRAAADEAFLLLDGLLPSAPHETLHGAESTPAVEAFRRSVDATLATAFSTRLDVAVQADRWAWALIEGERLNAADPVDEGVAANYARALALAGRRGDALAALARTRRALRSGLGIEPGPVLDAAEAEILAGKIVSHAHEAASDRASRILATPFLGRSAELRRILQAVAKRLPVRVVGGHGSGVSRLLTEAQMQLTRLGVRTIRVRAEEYPSSATSLLEELIAETGVTKSTSQNALSAFTLAVSSLTADEPTIFIVDDAQYLGATSWQALQHLTEAEQGGLIIGGHPSTGALRDGVDVVLPPIDRETSARLLQHWGVTDSKHIDYIVTAASGSPLALELLARDLWDQSAQAASPSGDGGPTRFDTSQFDGFLQRIVDELGRDETRDLELAAVAGDGYPAAGLRLAVWGRIPEPPAHLVDVDAHGLIRFRYAGLPQYLYEKMSRATRLDLHYSLGSSAREAGAPAATIARHLVAAADLDADAAIEAARAAARDSARLGAHADAAEWLSQARTIAAGSAAADLDDRTPTTQPSFRASALMIEHADALRLSGDPAHLALLVEAARQALGHADESLIAQAGFALLQLGGASPAGRLDPGLDALAGELLEAISDPELRAPMEAAASLSWSMTGNAKKARALFDSAEAAATTVEARLAVLPFAYLAVGRPQDLELRSALAGELLALARAAGVKVALWEGLHLTFTVALQRGDGALLRQTLQEMESIIEDIGDVGRRWSTQYCSATLAQLDGDLVRSETLTAQAYSMFRSVSPDRAAAAYYGQIMAIRLAQGRVDELRPIVLQLVEEQPGVTAWHAAAALVLATEARDEPSAGGALRDAARAHAETALEQAQDDFTWLVSHLLGGKAAALLRDVDLIERHARLLTPWEDLVCWQGTCSFGPVAAVLAELAAARDDPAAAAAYRRKADDLTAALAGGRTAADPAARTVGPAGIEPTTSTV